MLGIKYPEFLVLVSGVSGGKGEEKIKMESESKGKRLTEMQHYSSLTPHSMIQY